MNLVCQQKAQRERPGRGRPGRGRGGPRGSTCSRRKSCGLKSLGEQPHQSTMCLYWHLQPSFRFQLVMRRLLSTMVSQWGLFSSTVWKKDCRGEREGTGLRPPPASLPSTTGLHRDSLGRLLSHLCKGGQPPPGPTQGTWGVWSRAAEFCLGDQRSRYFSQLSFPSSLQSDFKMFLIIQDIFYPPGREGKSLRSRPHMGTTGNM